MGEAERFDPVLLQRTPVILIVLLSICIYGARWSTGKSFNVALHGHTPCSSDSLLWEHNHSQILSIQIEP